MPELIPEEFNAFLADLGQAVLWRPSRVCPCRNRSSGAARADCPVCAGLGVVWDAGVASIAAMTGVKAQRSWAEFGRWENGDTVLTLPSDQPIYAMGEGDRVMLLHSSEPFSLVVPWGGTISGQVVSISACTSVDFDPEAETPEVTLPIPRVEPNGTLSWASGAPPSGTQVAVTGRRRPEYFCLQDFPQDRAHHQGRELPRRVVLRRFDVWGR